ncbi:hypothetical protein [Hydrogenophaga sp. Root209]|uniref:hypothetical protein n=1 Tax=Hydrogenophaga sp. Root209 TaxID=1736490 RepID=UPI000A5142B9|nr:hypothetical protein [Hydrogenophaga sp. Root209]
MNIREPEEEFNRTSVARAVLRERLKGQTTLERGRERAQTALSWMYRWGWASSTTLEILVGSKRSGLASRLVKNKLAVITKTNSRRNEKYLPGSFLTLTHDGKHMVEINRTEPMQYEHRPDRINQNTLLHNEMVQRFTAEHLASGEILDYWSEKEMRTKSQSAVKHPDAVWLYPCGMKVSIEVELSPKWERDLDVFVYSTLLSLRTTNGSARFDKMRLITDAPAILKRYKEAFKPGANFWIWRKNDSGRWIAEDELTVPAWTPERIDWKLV